MTLRLRDGYVFMWQSVKILNVFSTLTLKQIFWRIKTFFKKLEYRFLVESTKIENASFPYKTAISEANVKTNKMVTTKWTSQRTNGDHKERSFAGNYLIFIWKFCFSLRTPYKELICCTNNPNAHICTFCKCWSFLWQCFSPVSILNSQCKSWLGFNCTDNQSKNSKKNIGILAIQIKLSLT